MADLYQQELIEDAIKLLKENGYIIVRITEGMKADMEECIKCGVDGCDKDCLACSCGMCVMQ